MKKLMLITMVLFLSFSFAQNNTSNYYVDLSNSEDLVNPNDYFEYMIIKGDCLWFIADNFYNDPYKWTKIHEANPYIINPDWIYPNNWLVIPNIFTDEFGKPILGIDKKTSSKENTTLGESSKTWGGDEKVGVNGKDSKDTSDAMSDAYNMSKDTGATTTSSTSETAENSASGKMSNTTKMTENSNMAGNSKNVSNDKMMSESNMPKNAESMTSNEDQKDMSKGKGECSGSYCGKPGWKLGIQVGTPLASAPEDESLNLGILLGTPLGVKVGPLSIGIGVGAFTYNFDTYYFGGGLLASLCVNDLLKLDIPLIIQLHGAGLYVFGDESGPGFGGLGSLSLPIGNSPVNIGVYGGIGKYYPGDNDYNWGNVGAVLFYNF